MDIDAGVRITLKWLRRTKFNFLGIGSNGGSFLFHEDDVEI
jgi:hypothetical protein